ncbi:MAG: thioredoxin [Lachnospiraceae bacterium]|nr:thioredoxin [Lachnospiraceae bacterium]
MVDKKKRRIVRVVALVLGVALLALGFLRGESDVILQKAIFVCYECIGIG